MGTWSDMMVETVTVAEESGLDAYGQKSYGTQSSIKCSITSEKVAARSPDGVLLMDVTKIYTHDPVTNTMLIWLPGQDTTDESAGVKPSGVEYNKDPYTGEILYEVML